MSRRVSQFISGVFLPTGLVACFGAFMIVFSGYAAQHGTEERFPETLTWLGVASFAVALLAALTLIRHYRERLRLEEQIDEERGFAGIVAHQLRQGLTAIAWSVEAASDPSMSDSQRLDALRDMKQAVTRGNRTVGALLRAARLEHGRERVKRDSVALASLVNEAWAQAKDRDPSKTVNFLPEVPDDAVAVLDGDLTIEVLRNIMDNAIVHGPAENTIEVQVRRPGAGSIALMVSDHGYGISLDVRAKMFSKGARGDSSQGTGLGLYLTRGLMALMGGSIAFDTSPQGTTFTLTFPTPDK
jgi:signal transduction histidine kinase